MGEDGGLFMLLNNSNDQNNKIVSESVSEDYLKEKIKPNWKGANYPD